MRRSQGFSIIELMTVLIIAALVTAFAVPGFQDLQRKSRISALSEELVTSLSAARTMAVTQRRQVFLVTSPSGTNYPTGWDVHADSVGGTLIEHHQLAAPATLQLRPCAACGSGTVDTIKFLPSGLVERNDTSAALDMTYRICDSSAQTEVGRDVLMNRIGRLYSKQHDSAATCNP